MAARRMENGAGGGGGGSRLTKKDRTRPHIELVEGCFSELCDMIEQSIIDKGLPVFNHGGRLVFVAETEAEDERGETFKAVALVPVTPPLMLDLMDQAAQHHKWSQRKREFVPCDPQEKFARVIVERVGSWQFQSIAALTTAPTIDRRGNIIDVEGVHKPTRLLLWALPKLPPMPQQSTKDDALAALATLKDDLLSEFAFVDKPSLSVALAMLVSPLCRGAVPRIPLMVAHAHVAGSGKSYLCTLVAAILTGRPVPVVPYAERPEEFEKRLIAILLAGHPVASLDNVNGTLKSFLLCQALSEDLMDVRPLGTSKTVRVEPRTAWLANGNNTTVSEDLTRRTLRASIDRNEAQPEMHEYKRRPHEMVLADRGKYIAACLTIVRAYILAGRPCKLRPLASYEQWSRTVREALVWLGEADPVETMHAIKKDDPARQRLISLFETWPTLDIEYSTAELIHESVTSPPLRAALLDVASDGKGDIGSTRLGIYLREKATGQVLEVERIHNNQKVTQELKLLKLDAVQGALRWKLKRAKDCQP
ncbi:hypothetical protein I6F15_03505 [Bradyrhizobium sp. BRP14]|nr:hypothetical protein [Bradyrhizobium sp. BRP14]